MDDAQPPPLDLTWMRILAEENPVPQWNGDLSDDCSAHWAGFTLRAECMDDDQWWWATYLDHSDLEIASSNDDGNHQVSSGDAARTAALEAARAFLYPV